MSDLEDEDEEDLEVFPAEPEFIILDNGRMFVRKFEIVGMRWDNFVQDGSNELGWCLKVFFSDVPHGTFYGDDAAAILKAFNLPEQPPR